MHTPFTFEGRIICLLALMGIVVAFDFLRNGAKASKHREYGFILLAGLLAAAVGFANDLITSTISPEYFIYGKGLTAGNDLRLQAGFYGMKAGLAAGIVGGAIILFLTPKKASSPSQFRSLLFGLWMPLAGAIFLAALLPLLAGTTDPFHFGATLAPLLNSE